MPKDKQLPYTFEWHDDSPQRSTLYFRVKGTKLRPVALGVVEWYDDDLKWVACQGETILRARFSTKAEAADWLLKTMTEHDDNLYT